MKLAGIGGGGGGGGGGGAGGACTRLDSVALYDKQNKKRISL